ncbi:hypothetical protein FNH05_26435 [Amycolatopsis rhizosphaerae]|uniref:Uncharacterized protein n=1 Tax=Amycolatopsis rhizosphaerae TaxID=2053003 RepID=A0A558BE81_9PSEU|nr:hypothetical protein [Amycolatopsis rhizosphaerae]TVT34825.1 hypothetical protein FNH05_26435 [Amycolatopsis rhizosphaerae]
MPAKKPAAPRDSGQPKPPPSGRVVALRSAVGWLAVLVLGAVMAVGFVSGSTLAIVAGLVLGLLLAVLAASAAVIMSGRVWLLFPAFLITCLYIASVAVTSVGYLAVHGTRFTATAVSSECHRVKGGHACTARLRRPDGTMLDDAVSVAGRMDVGQTIDVVEDPAGIVATHPADELDPVALTVGTVLAGAAAVLLAGLFALAAWLGLRRPKPQTARNRPGRANRRPRRPTR